jgi:Lhr-like helicase
MNSNMRSARCAASTTDIQVRGSLPCLPTAQRRGADDGALIHRDEINGRLCARLGARLTSTTSDGTILDNSDFQVLLEPEKVVVGTLNEDFAVESLAGDIFQLGNAPTASFTSSAGSCV